jgi:hypothetical protein
VVYYHRRLVQRLASLLVAVTLSGLLAAPGVFAQTAPAPNATPLPQRLDAWRPTVHPGLRFAFCKPDFGSTFAFSLAATFQLEAALTLPESRLRMAQARAWP